MTGNELSQQIEQLFQLSVETLKADPDAKEIFSLFIAGLNSGTIRAAEPSGSSWRVNEWVKKGILVGFRLGEIKDVSINENFPFYDKDTFLPKRFSQSSGVRIVPGGSTIRNGSFVAANVVCMPPMYINVGAYVDEGTLVDSHALVGSCAQIGKRVHLSAAAQIGGVLEPVGAMPVIIEDDVLVGGNTGVYEGTIVRKNAVLGTGVILTRSTPIYDIVNERVIKASDSSPLEVPEGAVVVAGSRVVKGDFARDHSLSIYTPLIVKYRDEKTDARTALEDSLRIF